MSVDTSVLKQLCPGGQVKCDSLFLLYSILFFMFSIAGMPYSYSQ